MKTDHPILILGASGWLGNYLIPEILKTNEVNPIWAGYSQHGPKFISKQILPFQISPETSQKLEMISPSVVINLTRGEEEIDFNFHKELIDFSNQKKIRYIYASSSNAFDATPEVFHSEDDKPYAASKYGMHKARCENELFKSCNRPLAFRFSATHGWAPNRIARTEAFLQRLNNQEIISMNKDVIQNRTFIGDLTQMIATLLNDSEAEGVFHLGTSDWSEELSFLQKMAIAFGYSSKQIVEDKSLPWNAVTFPTKWQKKYPKLVLPTEQETILKVRSQKQLSHYIKN
jgi:dTDP-4-dehydrorhamnose reductase